jgi:hypothetical protein
LNKNNVSAIFNMKEENILPGPSCQEQTNFKPEFYDSVGIVTSKQGFGDKAMAYFSEALRPRPDFPEARKNSASAPARPRKSKDTVQP